MDNKEPHLSEEEQAYEQAVLEYQRESSLFQQKAKRDLRIALSVGSLIAALPFLELGRLKLMGILDQKSSDGIPAQTEKPAQAMKHTSFRDKTVNQRDFIDMVYGTTLPVSSPLMPEQTEIPSSTSSEITEGPTTLMKPQKFPSYIDEMKRVYHLKRDTNPTQAD